jgi:hypothetical protein
MLGTSILAELLAFQGLYFKKLVNENKLPYPVNSQVLGSRQSLTPKDRWRDNMLPSQRYCTPQTSRKQQWDGDQQHGTENTRSKSPPATLSPAWISWGHSGLNPRACSEKPVYNHPRHETAYNGNNDTHCGPGDWDTAPSQRHATARLPLSEKASFTFGSLITSLGLVLTLLAVSFLFPPLTSHFVYPFSPSLPHPPHPTL